MKWTIVSTIVAIIAILAVIHFFVPGGVFTPQALTPVTQNPSGSCSPPNFAFNQTNGSFWFCAPGDSNWHQLGITSGSIVMKMAGSCDTGWTEVSVLNGQDIRGTLNANGDVGTTGGNATITPTGTVSQPTFTGSGQTFSVTNAVTLLGAGTALTGPSSYTPS